VVTASGSAPVPAAAGSPNVADDMSITSVCDRSRNCQRRPHCGINVTIASEVMVEKEVSAKGLADDKVVGMTDADRRADHRRGMTKSALPKAKVIQPKFDRKGKGKAIDAYEQAGLSRITEIVDPAPSGTVDKASRSFSSTGSSATPPPVTTVDGLLFALVCAPKKHT